MTFQEFEERVSFIFGDNWRQVASEKSGFSEARLKAWESGKSDMPEHLDTLVLVWEAIELPKMGSS